MHTFELRHLWISQCGTAYTSRRAKLAKWLLGWHKLKVIQFLNEDHLEHKKSTMLAMAVVTPGS